jgi:hypothetical protein
VLDGSHAEGTKEHDLIASTDGVDLSVGTAVSTRLAAEVVLEDLLALGGHVATSVLADVLPSLTNKFAIDLELVEGVVATHSDGQSQDGSGSLHLEHSDMCFELQGVKEARENGVLRSTKKEKNEREC